MKRVQSEISEMPVKVALLDEKDVAEYDRIRR
jgi:hypothetical protein